MIRRPPRSTLFPSPTLSRSRCRCSTASTPASTTSPARGQFARRANWPRSEEHTSELQSRLHLVCRLLLEKKKKHHTPPILLLVEHSDSSNLRSTSCLSLCRA